MKTLLQRKKPVTAMALTIASAVIALLLPSFSDDRDKEYNGSITENMDGSFTCEATEDPIITGCFHSTIRSGTSASPGKTSGDPTLNNTTLNDKS